MIADPEVFPRVTRRPRRRLLRNKEPPEISLLAASGIRGAPPREHLCHACASGLGPRAPFILSLSSPPPNNLLPVKWTDFSRRPRLFLAAALVLLLAACDSSPPPPLRVGTIPFPGYNTLHLADELHLYDAAAPVRLIEFSSSTQVLRAFRNGMIEAAALTLDEALELAEDVPGIRIVLVLDISNGADVVMGRPGLTRMADVRGRRIGYESTGVGAYILARSLEASGLKPADVSLVAFQFDEHEKALNSGVVDAIVIFEPSRSRLLATGAKVLWSSAEIPGEIMDVLVVHRTVIENNPRGVESLLRGHFQARDYQQQSPADADRLTGVRLNLMPAQIREALRLLTLPDLAENQRLLLGSPAILHTEAARLGAVLLQHQLLRQLPPLDTLIEGGPLKRLAR